MDEMEVVPGILPFASQFRLHVLDHVIVLGMGHDDAAVCRHDAHHFQNGAVVDPDASLPGRDIGREDLYRGGAILDGFGDTRQRLR